MLGLGNPILSDDGVGIHVVRALAGQINRSDVEVAEASVGGLRLLDTAVGYNRLILVDAIQAGGRVSQVYRLGPNDLPCSLHAASSHDLSLPAALELGRQLGLALPADEAITILAVEVEDVTTFGETCTPQVHAAIPRVMRMVVEEILTPEQSPLRTERQYSDGQWKMR